MWIFQRRVVLVPQAISQRQTRQDFPGILAKEVPVGGANTVHGSGKLRVAVKEPTYEVGQRIPRKIRIVPEIKDSIVIEIKSEVVSHPANVSAKLDAVVAVSYGNAVLPVESDVVNLGGSLRVGP